MYTVLITEETEKMITSPSRHKVIGQEIEEGIAKDVYGFPDQIQQMALVEVKILEQQVETLDLPAVIAAVNGLKLAI